MKTAIRSEVTADKIRLGILDQTPNHLEYGLGKNTMLLKITQQSMRRWKNHRYVPGHAVVSHYNDPLNVYHDLFTE